MTDVERARLARILGMLGSEHAGERAAAGLKAEEFRKKHGLTWPQMLSLPPLMPDPPQRDPAKEAAEAKARTEAETRRAAKAAVDAAAREAQHAAYRAAARERMREADEREARAAPPPPPPPEPEPHVPWTEPRYTPWTWTPPRPPRLLPFEQIWRPKLEGAYPMVLICALISFWIISIAGAIAGKF
jgi:hypothetical protein